MGGSFQDEAFAPDGTRLQRYNERMTERSWQDGGVMECKRYTCSVRYVLGCSLFFDPYSSQMADGHSPQLSFQSATSFTAVFGRGTASLASCRFLRILVRNPHIPLDEADPHPENMFLYG